MNPIISSKGALATLILAAAVAAGLIWWQLAGINNVSFPEASNVKNLQALPTSAETTEQPNVYRSEDYGFEITLPEGWVSRETVGGVSFETEEIKNYRISKEKDCAIGVITDPSICAYDVYSYIRFDATSSLASDARLIEVNTIGGKSYSVFESEGLYGRYTHYITSKGERVYQFSTTGDVYTGSIDVPEIIEEILISLKFID